MRLSELHEHFDHPTNRLYQQRELLQARGERFIDLISGNATAAGLSFPSVILNGILRAAVRRTDIYRPDPRGQASARQAISRYYQADDLVIPPEQILLTPGTSLAYWYAFKILSNSGDEILNPVPSYPLFETIAALAGVKMVPYALKPASRWQIDFTDLEPRITPRTRAIILISPHNPTGAVATQEELQRLAEIARRHDLAIISDEVFCPFLYGVPFHRAASTTAPLVITLSGFSKMLALPGLKLGWMTLSGDAEWVRKSLKLLEMISDTFLPVNEAVQAAVPDLFTKGRSFLNHYKREINRREKMACQILNSEKRIRFIPPEGGFYIVAESGGDDEEIVLQLLRNQKVLVHPGYFYDLGPGHLVFSFVQTPRALKQGLTRLQAGLFPKSPRRGPVRSAGNRSSAGDYPPPEKISPVRATNHSV